MGQVTIPLPRRLLHWSIEVEIEIIPHYLRSARNISADGLTRWGEYECGRWMYEQGITPVEMPELWLKWETEWEQRLSEDPFATFELLPPLYDFYTVYKMRVAEWLAHLYGTARILSEQGIKSQCLDIQNRIVFQHLPETVSEYTTGDVFLLIGTGGRRMEMDDFKTQIRRILPRYAAFLTPGWTEDVSESAFWSDIITVDSAAYGDVVMGQYKMFRYGGLSRNQCGFQPHAHVVRALPNAYHSYGFEIDVGPTGYRQVRHMENTTGDVATVATGPNKGVYSGDSHIPFPNTPIIRGIGSKRPQTSQKEDLTLCQRAVVLGGEYSIGNITYLSRTAIEYAAVSAPRYACIGTHYGARVVTLCAICPKTVAREVLLLSKVTRVLSNLKALGWDLRLKHRPHRSFSLCPSTLSWAKRG